LPDDAHGIGGERGFLPRFAQRGGGSIFIAIATAAGRGAVGMSSYRASSVATNGSISIVETGSRTWR